MVRRQIVKINEDLCNGCGLCVTPCAKGAIAIVNGKARVMNEELCDGAGFCLAACPTGALTIEERQTAPFNKGAAEEQQKFRIPTYIAQSCFRCGSTEERAVLLPCRRQGESLWVCTRCLPYLIHG